MLKENKLLTKRIDIEGEVDIIGYYDFEGFDSMLSAEIKDMDTKNSYNDEEYYFTEFKAYAYDSDYHSFSIDYNFKGVFLAFNLNMVDTLKYFGKDLQNELYDEREFLRGINVILGKYNMIHKFDEHDISVSKKGYLKVILIDKKLDNRVLSCANDILEYIREYYNKKDVHITRMFGSYILLKNVNGKLKAIKATPIPIKYCPLMVKLLKEVGGEHADALLKSLKEENPELQSKMMCKLINEVVIDGGYFDTNRPLNSCEANVLFGASETMSSAFKEGIIDAAVIVSNNLGTIITTNDSNTQGAVKRMTGLFHTSPSKKLIKTATDARIDVVFPYTASIDQLEGVKKAIRLGYKNIAVSVAAEDNYLHKKLKELEKDGVKIYKFGLCSTGISEETAKIMMNDADVIWSCASKQVKNYIEPNAIAQVGIKIPVHIMTEDGWNIVSNHLKYMDSVLEIDNINLTSGEEEPVFLNNKGIIKKMKKKDVRLCSDCPHPCI